MFSWAHAEGLQCAALHAVCQPQPSSELKYIFSSACALVFSHLLLPGLQPPGWVKWLWEMPLDVAAAAVGGTMTMAAVRRQVRCSWSTGLQRCSLCMCLALFAGSKTAYS